MYMIKDDYGTCQFAWIRVEAMLWLDACSPNAKVWNIFTGKVVARKCFGTIFD